MSGFAYFLLVLRETVHLRLAVSACLALLLCVILTVFFERGLFQKLRRIDTPGWIIFVISLSAYSIGQNLLSMKFGETIRTVPGASAGTYAILHARVTDVQLFSVVFCVVGVSSASLVLSRTAFGRRVRAVSSNPYLSVIMGVEPEAVGLAAAIAGTAFLCMGSLIYGLDSSITPELGFPLFIRGLVVVLVGERYGFRGLLMTAALIGFGEQVVIYFISSTYSDGFIYLCLVLFVGWRGAKLGGLTEPKAKV
jgi:branched-chain amino acid transport system permease protein